MRSPIFEFQAYRTTPDLAADRNRITTVEEAIAASKYKMTLQAIAIHGLLIHYTYLHVDFFAAGMFILWLAMGVSSER